MMPSLPPSARLKIERHRRRAKFIAVTFFLALSLARPLPGKQFTDVSVEAGLHRDFTRAWGNPLWGDFNNDGQLDLLVSNHETPSGVHQGGILPYLYINNGDGTFTDMIDASGIMEEDPDTGAWQGISLADYDNDGNLDIFISEPPFQGGGQGLTRDILYKGNGDATWTYVSDTAGIVTSRDYGECSFFVDYDNDGNLDLFVKNIPNEVGGLGANVLYRNNGDGTFSVVPGAAGLADAEHGVDEGSLMSFADYDNDGYMDVVFGGNDVSEALYHNNGDGTFSDVTRAARLKPKPNTEGLAWGDYDNDGFLDLYVSRGKQSGQGELGNTLYHNNQDGTFTDVTLAAGVNDDTNTWAAAWGDYDNDGFLDLFVARPGTRQVGAGNANLLYHNNGDGTFTDVATAAGAALQDDSAMSAHKLGAWGDYNNDGYIDLAIKDGIGPHLVTREAYLGRHYLLKNSGGSNHYLKIVLQGGQSNRFGIGARVSASHDSGIAFRQNNGGGGGEWASQGAGPLYFGIGSATSATVTVNWPSGVVDVLSSVAADSTLTVVEGSSQSRPPKIREQPANVTVSVGQKATFQVTATGTQPLSYQWTKDGIEIAGATRFKYVTPPVTAEDDGSRFSVIVSNSVGSVTSRDAKLKVIP